MLAIAPLAFMLSVKGLAAWAKVDNAFAAASSALGLCRALGRKRIDAVLDLLAQQASPLTGLREAERCESAEAHHGLFALRARFRRAPCA